jgi:hypothetical protein
LSREIKTAPIGTVLLFGAGVSMMFELYILEKSNLGKEKRAGQALRVCRRP